MLDHRAPTNGEIKPVSTQQSQCSDYIYRGCDLHPVTMETSSAADVQSGCFCGWLIFKGRGYGAVILKARAPSLRAAEWQNSFPSLWHLVILTGNSRRRWEGSRERRGERKKSRRKDEGRGEKENSLIFIKQLSCIGKGICVLNSLWNAALLWIHQNSLPLPFPPSKTGFASSPCLSHAKHTLSPSLPWCKMIF